VQAKYQEGGDVLGTGSDFMQILPLHVLVKEAIHC
jgi:hypothetical protein